MGDKPVDDMTEHEGLVCRTVCSGLNGLIPLTEIQGRKVVVMCNLKPVKMRGVKSCAMGPVELVAPPEGSKAGDRVGTLPMPQKK
ncbi:G4 quadruplex nucleic acid binding protein [Beauveria asiatica]|uniref:G4 quadruplex nucleic acid binding protein n=1 Tax=Beauveria asiatica TaxID=1069075 RepID=A0AAW0RH61_9HYPO